VKTVKLVHVDQVVLLEHQEETETPVYLVHRDLQDLPDQVVTALETYFLLVKKDLVLQ